MSLPFMISGSQTVVPGVYSEFHVAGSLPAPTPAGRNVYILGEAEEGIPGELLDLKANFFTDFQSVKDFYRSGPIVDAARMLFSNQPSAVFSGAVARLYIWKTNNSTRAEKVISSPTNYGKLVAARYGENGNKIKSQIKTGQAESKPSKTFAYLPSPAGRTFAASVDGVYTGSLSVAADGLAAAFVTAMSGASGLSASGGAARTTIASGPMTADLSASADVLTITRSSGSATFDSSSIQLGDSCYIDAGLAVSGTADKNAGSYLVTAVSSTSLSLRRMKSHDGSAEVNSQAFDLPLAISIAASDLKINAPVTLSVSATTADGSGASLELLEDAASKLGLGMMYSYSDLANILVDSTSSVAKISASVPSAGKLAVSLSTGSWSQTPKVGDIIRIADGSLLQGSTKKNVGSFVVESASSQSLTMSHLFSGMTTEAVSQVSLGGANDVFKYAPSFVSTSVAARRIDSSAERKVKLEASRTSDGVSMPTSLIGGNVCFELSYYNAAATAATVSIDSQRIMTLDLTGSGLTDMTINTKKYETLQDLIDYLNTQSGFSARVPDSRMKSLPTSCLDMVTSVGILSGQSQPAYNGRIKKDYYDWKKYFEDNFGLISFAEGTMTLKVGLPAAESASGFLSGAAVGSTSNASIQDGLDAGLKIACRQVVPLFSRDASLDIDDGNTDTGSSYSIDAINAAVKAHVATASSTLFRKERFGLLSYDSSFADAVQKVGEIAYERCQFFFQRHDATDGNGDLKKFLPWMAACSAAAGRSQAVLGTSLLRKPMLLSSAEHTGASSLYSDTLTQDFDPDNRGQLEEAIAAGLMVLRAVPGFGVRVESPDLSSRSRNNDPEGWVWERVNVLFTADEVTDTCRNVLENFIGNRTSDTPVAIIRSALNDTLATFVVGSGNGALLSAKVIDVKSLGNQYKAQISITPAEALEAIILSVTAERSL